MKGRVTKVKLAEWLSKQGHPTTPENISNMRYNSSDMEAGAHPTFIEVIHNKSVIPDHITSWMTLGQMTHEIKQGRKLEVKRDRWHSLCIELI